MEHSGRRDSLTGQSPWGSGSSMGKHQRFGRGPENGTLSKVRFFLRPGTALGVALVVLLLSAVSIIRVLTLDGTASADDLGGSTSREQSLAVDEDNGSGAGESPEEGRGGGSGAGSGGTTGESSGGNTGEDPGGGTAAGGLGYGLAGVGVSSQGSSGGEVIIHVTGAVASPGVVYLSTGTRVLDAVEAAGGATEDADLSAINLAAFASDGSQVHVPKIGEAPRMGAPSSSGSTPSGGSAGGGGCIDLNTASEAELEGLDGVGPKLAERIARYRENNGPFSSSSDLISVDGIGPVLSARIAEGACQ